MSHAGAKPHLGINALNAATSALNVTNSLRETFEEKDYFRFHSIITKGGDSVNAVPDEVVVESYVRAASSSALIKANEKVNRAFSACAAELKSEFTCFGLIYFVESGACQLGGKLFCKM